MGSNHKKYLAIILLNNNNSYAIYDIFLRVESKMLKL